MQQQGKSRKPLIIGIVAAVAILAVVLVLLLTQCTGGGAGATTTPSTVEATEPVPTYELYWNADRAEYDGKSEAGMSSRMPESDGYFHVRFIHDGEEIVLKVADRKLINAIDIKDLMGLEFDENGIVIGVTDIDDMPLEKLGWQFYVQSAAKKLIKLNSSESMNGMEVLLETDENTGIYDMTGKSGPIGNVDDPINMDRVYAVANLAGEVTHVFIYQRPNYMLTHEAECQHCKKVVTWYEWVKEDEMPVATGHYQLMNDIQLKGQPAQQEDAKVCIDLNGKRVDGKSGSRCYAMFNAGTELAIMDTSEGQTGVMAAHGKGDQGMVVWVRYGAFYLYGGTLDASDATTKLNGTAIECAKGKYVYMYGGTIIGGTAEPQKNDKGNWTNGLGGAISLGGKFVMNGGEIRDGYAKSHVEWKNGNPTYYRGIGGNIFMSSSAVFELNDGEIRNGKAGNLGGNIYMEGTAEFTMNGGKITGGYINGKGKNGGNVFISGQKTVFTMNGGYIQNGQCRNCGGNVYLNGTFNMNGGVISGGRIRDFKTGATVENAASANVFVVNGQFFMRGGKVAGGFQLIDTDAKKLTTRLHLAGLSVIDGGENCTRNLTLTTGGSGIKVTVSTLHEKARIGVYATTGYFTEPTKEANKPMFFSDIEGAEILYHNERLALGRMQCVCGSNSDNVEDHLGACKEAGGEKLVFAPWVSASSMPNTAGNYYLLAESLSVGNTAIVTPGDGKGKDVVVNVDLNGKEVTSKNGRFYSLFENAVAKNPDGTYAGNIADEHIELSLSDSVGSAKVTLNERTSSDMGYLVWGRYNDSKITIYGGTYDGSAVSVASHNGAIINTSGELNIHAGTFDGGHSVSGGIIAVQGSKAVFNMTGGVIKNGTARAGGGNVFLNSGATFNLSGGSILDGSCNKDSTLVGDLAYGGNVDLANGKLNMTGGEIAGGVAYIGLKGEAADGSPISAGGGLGGNIRVGNGTATLTGGVIRDGIATTGGNIGTNNGNATIILDGVQLLDGHATSSGGNLAVNVRAPKLIEIKGDTLVSGGTANGNGGNIYINSWVSNGKSVTLNILGGTIADGSSGNPGGNIYSYASTPEKNVITMDGGTISGGKVTGLESNGNRKNGGSIYIPGNTEFILNGGTVTGGSNAKQGGNFYLNGKTSTLTVNGGEILNGSTNDCGGNVQLQGNALLVVNGGKILDGHHDNGATGSANNVYAVNSRIELTGGEVNGLAATNTTANGCSVKISGDAVVSPSKSNNGLGIGCWSSGTVNFDPPFVQLGELSDKASIAWSTAGFVTTATSEANLDNCTTTLPEASVHYVDGRIFVGQYACICGGTSELGPCAEGGHKKVTWLPWNGTSNLTKDGNYYLYQDVNKTSQRVLGKDDKAYNVNLNLNGHKITNSFRVFQLWDTATLSIADHKAGGALLTNGNTTDNYGGIQMLGNQGTVHFYSGKIGFAEGYKNHKEIALIESSGTFNMYGGEIFGGENPTGTLVNVGGTFNMYAGTVRDGNNTTINTGSAARGGNFRVKGTLNVYGGTITGGKALFGGNIAGTGKVNILGGTVTDGIGQASDAEYTRGGNIYMTGANAQLVVSGKDTVISGGTLVASPSKGWMPGGSLYADGGATITVEGGASVIGGDGQDGNNIYITTDSTKVFLKDCTIKNTVNGAGNIMVERGSVTIDGAQIINTANGYNLRANEGGKIANFTFNSGLVTGGKPNVTLGGDDTFVMNGGTIENGESANYGGNISLTSSKFTLNDGVITGGVAAKEGGNICMSGTAELIVNGGEISKGTANAGSGGNIIVWDTSSVTLNDGVISGGTCTGNGGNVSLGGKTTMTVNGGKVIEGESGDSAGNIAVYGKLTVNGGEILDGKCKNSGNGMNISVVATSADTTTQFHELVITGGKIGGGLHFNNYKGNTAIVSISGSPVIDKALSTKVTPTYSMKLGSNDLTIGQLTDGAKIVVSGEEGVFSYKAPEGSAKFFESEVEGLAVFQTPADELVLVYGKQGCICGSKDGTHIGECDGTVYDWIPVTAFPETSGYYYMISDFADSGAQRMPSTDLDIVLDLNGKTLTSNKWRMFRCNSKINFTVTDNSADRDGKIVIPAARDQGAIFWSNSTSTFAMYGGIIDASASKNNSGAEGLVLSGTATVKLFRGTIKGGTYGDNNWGGSAVGMGGGKTHYLGNVEITGEGSALFIGDGCKVDMTHVTKAPETPWTIDASGIFTTGWNKEWKIEDYFVSASAFGCQIYLDEATGELKMGIMDCACRQATCVGDCDGKDIFWQPYRTTSNMPTAAGNYFLTRNISGVGQKNITGDTKTVVRIDLNGKSVTVNAGSRLYLLQKTNELHVTDSVGTGTIIGGGHSANGGIFLPQGTSVLKIYAGNYTLREDATATPAGGWIDASSSGVSIFGGNFSASVNGGSLIVVRDNLTMNVTGGTFTNTANADTEQVTFSLWTGCTLNISNATITTTGENQRSMTTDGTVNMTNCTVTGAKLTKSAGGANICINDKGTLNLTNSTVSGGVTAGNGGNIAVYGKLVMKNSTVSGGQALYGGNIYVSNGTANITGGKITGGKGVATDTAYTQGGNIHITGASAVVTIDGTTVSEGNVTGTASKGWRPGGNIYMNGGASLTVGGGATIEGGGTGADGNNLYLTGSATKATLNNCTVKNTKTGGNNIMVEAGTLTVDGATITNTVTGTRNISTNDSGTNVGNIVIKSGTISGGSTTGGANGGNICICANDTLTISGGTIIGGHAENQGGNIALYGTMKMTGGTIKDGVSDVNAGHNIAVISPKADQKAVLEIAGGEIAGGVYFNCYYTTPTVKLSGKPVINKDLTSASVTKPTYGISVPASFDLDLTGLTGGEIHVKGAEPGQFAFNATEAMVDYFVSETYEGDVQLPVCYDNGGLCFGKVYCLCGASETGGTHSQGCLAVNGGKELIWLPADSAADLMAGGNFYLTKSFSTSMITLSKNTVIDLNGKTLSKADGQRIVSYYGSTDVTLTVTDATSAKNGSMVVSGSKTNQGGLFWLAGTNSKLNLVAGTFDASGYTVSAASSGRSGAGIDAASTSEINIYEGVTMKGGTVTHGNTTNGASGGAIATTGKLNIFGGTISGGKAHSGGNIYGGGSSTITISGGTISGGSVIGEKITVGEESKEIYGLGGNIYSGGVLTITGGTIEKGSATYGETSGWVAGGNLYVSKTVTISGGTITGGTSSSQGANIYAQGSSRITMSGGTVEKGTGVHGSGFYLDKGAQLTMSNGKIIDNTATGNGGNFSLVGKSVLTVTGGQISGGTAANGGNIYMEANSGNNPTVNVENITLTGGKATNGGNLYMKAGTATVKNAKVTDGMVDTSTGKGHVYGGNIFASGGTVTINNSTISGGTAKTAGKVDSSTYYAYGGNISLSGAAVLNVENNSVVTKGTVNSNGNWAPGGNVHQSGSATTNVTASQFTEGTASQGANIYVSTGTTLNVNSGKIANASNVSNILYQGGYINVKGGEIISTAANARNIDHNNEGAGVMTISGGTITGGTYLDGDGANLRIGSKLTVNMSGGTIKGGFADRSAYEGDSGYGGAIALAGTLNMSGGTITGGKVRGGTKGGGLGGNIFVSGTLNVTGGTIEKGDASTGGNIGSNNKNAVIKLSNVTIKDGTAGKGGNLCVNVRNIAECTVGEGTVISGGTATGNGGNIAVDLWVAGGTPTYTISFKNATVTGGTAGGKGGNIFVKGNATYKPHTYIDGITVTGGKGTTDNVGGVYLQDAYSPITMTGKVVISDNTGVNLWLGGASLAVNVGELASGSKIGVNAGTDRIITTVVDAAEAKYFFSDIEGRVVSQVADGTDKGKLYFGQMHCICGKLDGSCATYTNASGNKVGCNGEVIKWTAWTSDNTVPTTAGNYYLTKDVTIAKNTSVNEAVVLDLNGHTITVTAERLYNPGADAVLTLTNTVKGKGGVIIDGNVWGGGFIEDNATAVTNLYNIHVNMISGQSSYGGALINLKGTLNIFGDTILENGKSKPGSNGGNLMINGGSVLNMFDGIIRDGVATNSSGGGEGGNMQCWGTMNLYGDAEISNKAMSYGSGNIQLCGNNAVLNMYGGTLTGDLVTYQTPTINIYPNANIVKGQVRGLPTSGSVVANIHGDRTGKTPIAVTYVAGTMPVAFAQGYGITLDYAAKDWFETTDGNQIGLFEDGKLYVVSADAHMHCVCGGELAEDETHECVDIIYTEMTANDYKFYSDTDKTVAVNGNYYLTGDLNMASKMINLRHGSKVNICLNGHTLTSNTRTVSMFCDGTDGTNCGSHTGETEFVATPVLNLASCQDGGVVASNNTTSENGRVLWARLGDINCYGITIDASKSTKLNGTSTGHTGIAVQTTSADATLYNCVVKGGIDESLANNDSFGAAMSVNGKGTLALVGTFELQTADKAIGLYVADGSKLDVSRLESVNAPISVSASGVFTEGLDESGLKLDELFTSFISGMDVFTSVNTEAGEAFFGKASCLCGSTTDEHIGECDGSRVELAAWRVKGSLPRATGNYILTSGAVKTGRNTPNDGAKIVVNLNGQTVTGTDRIYTPMFIDGNTGYQCKSATLNIVNGKMVAHTSGTQGGVFWMGNNATVSLYNVTVDARGRTATGSGTVADTAVGSVFNMFGNTTLYGGTTANHGGTMAISGQLNMWDDSKIIGGTTTIGTDKEGKNFNTTGGALYVRSSSAVVTMNDNAIIQDGICQNNGGNVYITSGKLVMNDNAQILNGKACNISGNIQVASGQTLEMHGGKIAGGMTGYNTETKTGSADANSSNGTILNNGKLIMTGGEIEGRINAFAYSAGCSPKITLSGDAKIAGGSIGLRMTIDKGDLFSITIGEGGLTNGANIVINNGTPSVLVSGTTIVTNVSSSDVAYISGVSFLYDNTEKIITLK